MAHHTAHAHGVFSWVDLSSHNLDATKAFYAAIFGWTYSDMAMGDGAVYSFCQKHGESVCAISTASAGQSTPQWQSHITVNNVDATVKTATALGGIVTHHHDVFDAGRMAIITDPTGADVALWQANRHIGAHYLGEHGTLAWNELHTGNVKAATDFYTAMIGWGSSEMPMPDGPYTMFCERDNPKRSHGGCVAAAKGEAPHWQVVFHVDDCDKAVAAVQKAGGKITQPATDIPGMLRSAKCTDPMGAAFSLMQPL